MATAIATIATGRPVEEPAPAPFAPGVSNEESKRSEGAAAFTTLRLASPPAQNAGDRENRRHARARLDIRVVWVKGSGSTVRGAVGRACDLSESGISAVLPAKIAVGEVSELQFTLPGTKDLMVARVIVRSSEGFRYGFEFLHLSQKQRETLCRVCARLAVLHH